MKDAKAMAIDRKLLDVLCCPVTKQPVRVLKRTELKALNERIDGGEVRYQDDSPVDTPLEAGLITANEERIYRVDDGIPVMLEDRAINLRAAGLK
ncbi:Trm112 family protein [Spiribacter salinus]|nr:Trm112 family protein [Spiribacter salinus]